jgi:hypothetical protein
MERRQEASRFLAGQAPRTHDGKAAARTDQGFVDVADIMQVGRDRGPTAVLWPGA